MKETTKLDHGADENKQAVKRVRPSVLTNFTISVIAAGISETGLMINMIIKRSNGLPIDDLILLFSP